jgi:hypothetical protein
MDEGAACEDGDPCTVMDRCEGDECRGLPKDCEDGLECTIDTCDPQTGACRARPDRTCCERMVDCDSGDCTELVRACIVTLGDAGPPPDVDAGGSEGDAAIDAGAAAAFTSRGGGGCGCTLTPNRPLRGGWFLAVVACIGSCATRARRAWRSRAVPR